MCVKSSHNPEKLELLWWWRKILYYYNHSRGKKKEKSKSNPKKIFHKNFPQKRKKTPKQLWKEKRKKSTFHLLVKHHNDLWQQAWGGQTKKRSTEHKKGRKNMINFPQHLPPPPSLLKNHNFSSLLFLKG